MGEIGITCLSNTELKHQAEVKSNESPEIKGEINNTFELSTSSKSNEIGVSENYENYIDADLIETHALSSQKLAETAHEETKQSMLNEHGKYMSKEQIERLKSGETKENLKVMSSEEYTQTFTDIDFNVLGHCDSEGNIYMKDISPEIVKHVSTHETMHLCANREHCTDESGNKIFISGLRENRFDENGSVFSLNQGFNEGLTEMYTLRELQNRGDLDSEYALNAYSESRIWSERIEKLVGNETMAAAYFGGERNEFIYEFNRLNNNDLKAWENFSLDIDTLEYSNDPIKIEQAKWRLMSQYSTMAHNKFGI
mgnify:CR=1 FL=1